jgi:dolichyl-diphosphooligosaccharide--protein glycosyltransferase
MNNEKEQINYIAILFAFILLIILLYPRVGPFIEYFQEDDIIFRDPDTCYHARRIIYTATHNMKPPFYDPLLAHPYGAVPVWSPLYDWISALPSFIIGLSHPTNKQILITACIITIILGLIQLVFIYLITYKIIKNPYYSLLAAFMVGISNPQIRYTSLEILDHNSLLLCLFSISLYLLYRILEPGNIKITLAQKLFFSIIISALFWTWPGSFIYVGILFALSSVICFMSKNCSASIALAHIYLIACILLLPLTIINSKFSSNLLAFEFVSFFAILFLFSISIAHYLLALLINILNKNRGKLIITKSVISVLILLILVYFQLSPLLRGMRYATAQNAWLETIIESQPLFYDKLGEEKIFTIGKVTTNMSFAIFLVPVAIALIIIRKIQLSSSLILFLLLPTFITFALAISQQKFIIEFSIFYGVLIGLFMKWLSDKISKKIIIYIINIVILITASIPAYSPVNDVKTFFIPNLAYKNAYAWLKNELNEKNISINTAKTSDNGVMTTWGFGHHLHYYSNAATIADNFGFIYIDHLPWEGFFDMVNFYLAESEEQAIDILKKYKCKYIIVPDYMEYTQLPPLINLSTTDFFTFQYDKLEPGAFINMIPKKRLVDSVGFRLSEFYGSANPFNNYGQPLSQALKHFQLVYELPGSEITKYPVREGYIKIFKFVEGTQINIEANQNEPYRLESLIITNTGKKFYYQQYGMVKDKIISPYPITQNKNYPYAAYYKVYTKRKVFTMDDIKLK